MKIGLLVYRPRCLLYTNKKVESFNIVPQTPVPYQTYGNIDRQLELEMTKTNVY